MFGRRSSGNSHYPRLTGLSNSQISTPKYRKWWLKNSKILETQWGGILKYLQRQKNQDWVHHYRIWFTFGSLDWKLQKLQNLNFLRFQFDPRRTSVCNGFLGNWRNIEVLGDLGRVREWWRVWLWPWRFSLINLI